MDEFSRFFKDKVNPVRSNTAGAPDAHFSTVQNAASLASFAPVNVHDVISAISHLPDKSSDADSLPVSVLKSVTEKIAPYLTELFNRSMTAGHFPSPFKEAFITLVIKKDVQSYSHRPISNLSVVSKLLERLVARQLNAYLQQWSLLP